MELTVPYDNYVHPKQLRATRREQEPANIHEHEEEEDKNNHQGSSRILEERRLEKKRKYAGLIDNCRQKFSMPVQYTVIVISSLGTVPRITSKSLKKVLGLNDQEFK
jgi:hypothetical protein